MTTISVATSQWAHETSGGVVTGNPTNFYAGYATPTSYYSASGVIFDTAIPQGTEIQSAVLNGQISYDDPYVDIYCEDADDPANFSTSAYNISSRTPTSAFVRWDAMNVGLSGRCDSIDFTDSVQEVVDRPGFDGRICVLFKFFAIPSQTRVLRYYVVPSSYDLTLDIEYGAAAPGNGRLIDRPLSGAMIL